MKQIQQPGLEDVTIYHESIFKLPCLNLTILFKYYQNMIGEYYSKY